MSEDDLIAGIPQEDPAVRDALATAEEWIGAEIQGVAVGETAQGEPCVVVYAPDPESPAVRELPSSLNDIPVRVEAGGPFLAE
ncbi:MULTISPECIES: hypothetical protein [Isoptericola]|uniref:Uncharacterized protein n=1 Tax=Isoptericola sediminis TaxID=2733572 RepID=A0A849K685_9MICO|nr:MULTISPECIES: hypothetical protein [Isoptericola]MDO8145303.1 hypothetical protein [Isoptericola sp. 178]MDO8148941.1 hypothetical protein [Isoptericola sp. b515]MDO8151116.1 hypothetical protein [Isoptericola sp. b408]NNU28451.1 hypothetical protein [Isoptericola sediminis]